MNKPQELMNHVILSKTLIPTDAAKAFEGLSNVVAELIQVLSASPEEILPPSLRTRLDHVQSSVGILQREVTTLINCHNQTQDTLRDMGEEIDKFHKIFDFLVSQKEEQAHVD